MRRKCKGLDAAQLAPLRSGRNARTANFSDNGTVDSLASTGARGSTSSPAARRRKSGLPAPPAPPVQSDTSTGRRGRLRTSGRGSAKHSLAPRLGRGPDRHPEEPQSDLHARPRGGRGEPYLCGRPDASAEAQRYDRLLGDHGSVGRPLMTPEPGPAWAPRGGAARRLDSGPPRAEGCPELSGPYVRSFAGTAEALNRGPFGSR